MEKIRKVILNRLSYHLLESKDKPINTQSSKYALGINALADSLTQAIIEEGLKQWKR
jgi:hypothetical protein